MIEKMKEVANVVMFLAVIYLSIGAVSFLTVANGENIPYMPFWHTPWKWLIKLF
ncbi:MAG: hypothetical protein AAB516_02050 [Patescibacteria group bacterium]